MSTVAERERRAGVMTHQRHVARVEVAREEIIIDELDHVFARRETQASRPDACP